MILLLQKVIIVIMYSNNMFKMLCSLQCFHMYYLIYFFSLYQRKQSNVKELTQNVNKCFFFSYETITTFFLLFLPAKQNFAGSLSNVLIPAVKSTISPKSLGSL